MFKSIQSIPSLQLGVVFLLSIFITFGVMVRVYQLGIVPTALYWDEAAMLADARMLLENGTDLHGRPWLQSTFVSYGDYKLPVYIWMTAFCSKLVGITPLAVRLPSMLAGLLTIANASLLTYLLIQSLRVPLSKNQTVIAIAASAALTAVTPWAIFFSRTGFEAHLSQAIAGFSIVLLIISLKAKNHLMVQTLGVILSSVVAVFGVYTYYSTRYVIPIVFSVVIMAIVSKDSGSILHRMKKTLMLVSVFALTFWVCLQPIRNSPTYSASNQFRLSTPSVLNIEPFVLASNDWRTITGNTLTDRVLFHRRVLQAQQLASHLSRHLDPKFLFFSGDANLRHGTGRHGLLLLASLPALLLGWCWLLRKSKTFASVLGVWWLAALLPASVPNEVPHALRSLNALLPIMISAGIGYGVFLEFLRQRVRTPMFIGLAAVIVTLSFLECSRFIHYYFTVYPFKSLTAWQHGYWAVAETVYDWSDTHQVIIAESEERLVLWLFAATDLPPSIILKSMQEYGPLPKKVGTIVVQKLDSTLLQGQGPILLVGREDTMKQFSEQVNIKPDSEVQISVYNDEVRYLMLEYKNEN